MQNKNPKQEIILENTHMHVVSVWPMSPAAAQDTLTFTMNVKSVKAGEYTAPPAQGPMMREIWGTTPEHKTFLWNRKKKSGFTKEVCLLFLSWCKLNQNEFVILVFSFLCLYSWFPIPCNDCKGGNMSHLNRCCRGKNCTEPGVGRSGCPWHLNV